MFSSSLNPSQHQYSTHFRHALTVLYQVQIFYKVLKANCENGRNNTIMQCCISFSKSSFVSLRGTFAKLERPFSFWIHPDQAGIKQKQESLYTFKLNMDSNKAVFPAVCTTITVTGVQEHYIVFLSVKMSGHYMLLSVSLFSKSWLVRL